MAQDRKDTLDKIKKIIVREASKVKYANRYIQRRLDEWRVRPAANLGADLGFDSMGIYDLVCGIEDEFRIRIPDEKIPSLVTVNDVNKIVLSLNDEHMLSENGKLLNDVANMMSDHFSVERRDVLRRRHLSHSLGIDLAGTEGKKFFADIEKKFSVKLSDDEIDNFELVEDFYNALLSKIAKTKNAAKRR